MVRNGATLDPPDAGRRVTETLEERPTRRVTRRGTPPIVEKSKKDGGLDPYTAGETEGKG